MKALVSIAVGLVVLLVVVVSVCLSQRDLTRLQELKNKRRFGGRRLLPVEAEELDRLLRKYPWY